MSQQEFEPQQQPDKEIYQPQYPYSWSDQAQREGLPRDEPHISYGMPSGQVVDQDYEPGQARGTQVPWWARPQPRQKSQSTFVTIVVIAILLTLLMGGLGIAGVVLGALAHILGVIIGAIFILFLFVCLLVFLILGLIARAISRAFGPPRTRRGRW